MRVKMRTKIGGYRNGEEWPDVGGVIDVPDHEAGDLIANGYAREAPDEIEAGQPDEAAAEDSDEQPVADPDAPAAEDSEPIADIDDEGEPESDDASVPEEPKRSRRRGAEG